MDCCTKTQETDKMKGGKFKMETRIMLWIVIGVMFVATLFLTFQAGAVGAVETVQATTTAAKTAAPSSSGMVGGC